MHVTEVPLDVVLRERAVRVLVSSSCTAVLPRGCLA